jgi:hypothetical protein
MSIRRHYRKSTPPQQMYVVLNRHGEVYAGMLRGQLQWSYNWSEAKPLHIENTVKLHQENLGSELIKEEEII